MNYNKSTQEEERGRDYQESGIIFNIALTTA